MKKIIAKSTAQTKKIAKELAKKILKKRPAKNAFIIGLKGDLGSGKTTFLQGFGKGLGVKEKILSPTFLIMKKFHVSGFKFHYFYHIDCYRINNPKELLDLGFEKILKNPQNIVAIEWSDKIKKIIKDIRAEAIFINFKFISKNKRKISFSKS